MTLTGSRTVARRNGRTTRRGVERDASRLAQLDEARASRLSATRPVRGRSALTGIVDCVAVKIPQAVRYDRTLSFLTNLRGHVPLALSPKAAAGIGEVIGRNQVADEGSSSGGRRAEQGRATGDVGVNPIGRQTVDPSGHADRRPVVGQQPQAVGDLEENIEEAVRHEWIGRILGDRAGRALQRERPQASAGGERHPAPGQAHGEDFGVDHVEVAVDRTKTRILRRVIPWTLLANGHRTAQDKVDVRDAVTVGVNPGVGAGGKRILTEPARRARRVVDPVLFRSALRARRGRACVVDPVAVQVAGALRSRPLRESVDSPANRRRRWFASAAGQTARLSGRQRYAVCIGTC